MKKLKITLAVLLSVIAIISPFISVICAAMLLPDPYERTFVGALDDKYDLLTSVESDKIVIVGGSSVAFGLDSEIISRYTEMPVVNFGLYAALGTKLMMDLSRSGIKEGDVVILSPELDAQTLSLYFSAEQTNRAIDGRADMFMQLPADNKLSLLGGLWRHTAQKLDYYLKGLSDSSAGYEDPEGVYNSANFNEYGDVVWDRPENIMPVYYDKNNMIDPTPDIVSADFIEYVNDYISYCNRLGAKVYFNFCPMNEAGLASGRTEADLIALEEYLSDVLDCTVLGSAENSLMEAGYFYDTNFHLNDAGVKAYTVRLTEDILFELESPKAVREEVPEVPPLPAVDVSYDYYDENEVYYTFRELPDGSYEISGLTEQGKAQGSLVLPIAYNYRKVTVLGSGALDGASARKIVIPKDTNLYALSDGSFRGASTVTELWIYHEEEADILPPSDFIGVGEGFVVHVPLGSEYSSGYYWSRLGLTFREDAGTAE